MNTDVKLGDVMTTKPLIIESNASVREAAKKMQENHKGSILIKEKGNLKGIFTERDLITLVSKSVDLDKTKVVDAMNEKLYTLSPDDDLMTALEIMKKKDIRRIPIVDEDSTLLGIVTIKDIIKIAPDLLNIYLDKIRIEEYESKLKRIKEHEEY